MAAFFRDAESYPLRQRVGALPSFDELAMLSSNVMLRFNRLADVNHDHRLTGAMGGFPERHMPVLRSAEHVSKHRRFEDVVVPYEETTSGSAAARQQAAARRAVAMR